MANATCAPSVQACRLRVARLNAGGAPEEGEGNLYVTDALISIQSSPEIEAGDDFTQKNGCGDICATLKSDDHIKRVTLQMTLCNLDGELLELLTGGTIVEVGGETVGFQQPSSTSIQLPVAVEAWSKVWNGNKQKLNGDGDPLYNHWVWPSTKWVPGQHTLENGILQVPLTGTGDESDGFGLGLGDLPVPFTTAEGFFQDANIPPSVCGYQELVVAGTGE